MPDDQISILNELDAFEVSLVDRGANKKRPFPIHKKENPMSMDTVLKAVLGTQVDAEEKLGEVIKDLSEEGKAAIVALARTVTSFSDEISPDAVSKALEICGVKVAKSDPKPDPKPDLFADVPAEIRKQLEPVVKSQQAQIDLITKELEVERATIAKEREERALAGWVTKAETDLSHYPGESAADLGAALYELHKANPEMASAQFDRMKAASEAIKASELLKVKGHGNDIRPPSNAMDAIQKQAEEFVAKSGGKVSIADAIEHVATMNPDLYAAYKREVQGG